MSKHRSSSDESCYNSGYGYGGGGYGGCGAGYGGWNIRWIYALLVLIVIVLQFGRNFKPAVVAKNVCDDTVVAAEPVSTDGFLSNQLIDNSVLFIIVVFLLILCAGCWTGGCANYGSAGYGGYGY